MADIVSGKSCYNVYAILRRLAEMEPVVFHSSTGRTLWFARDGVWKKESRAFQYEEYEHIRLFGGLSDDPSKALSEPWALIDPGQNDLISREFTSDCFYVVTIPPPPERYKRLCKDYARVWIMNPWSGEEIRKLYVLLYHRYPQILSPVYQTNPTGLFICRLGRGLRRDGRLSVRHPQVSPGPKRCPHGSKRVSRPADQGRFRRETIGQSLECTLRCFTPSSLALSI